MTGLCWPLLALAVVGAAFGLWQWFQRRRTLRRLGDMLDRAIAGGFAEERFDETELSALEGKLARFLRGSAHAQKTLEGEQAAVKALVADISHQTRTPISNLLLYASLLLESDLPPQQREQARAVMAQGEKLSFLIKALVKASRLETGIVVPVPSLHRWGYCWKMSRSRKNRRRRKRGSRCGCSPLTAQQPLTPGGQAKPLATW